jgi:hypothetical protein
MGPRLTSWVSWPAQTILNCVAVERLSWKPLPHTDPLPARRYAGQNFIRVLRPLVQRRRLPEALQERRICGTVSVNSE